MTSNPSVKDRRRPTSLVLLVGTEAIRTVSRSTLRSAGLLVAEAATADQAADLYPHLSPAVVVADGDTIPELIKLLPDTARVSTADDIRDVLSGYGTARAAIQQPVPVAPVDQEAALTALAELAALCRFTNDSLGLVMLDVRGVDDPEAVLKENVRDGDLVLAWEPASYVVAFMSVSEENLRGVAARLVDTLTASAPVTASVTTAVAAGDPEPRQLITRAMTDLRYR